MRTLKVAAIVFTAVLAAALLALMLGLPAGLIAGALQSRVEADTGYRLRIEGNSTMALWPSPALTIHDISLSDASGADQPDKLTAESIRFSFALSSLFAFYPQISEIAVTRPVLRVPLFRERPNPSGGASTPPRSRSPGSAIGFAADRATIDGGTVVLSSASGPFESRINGIALTASLSGRDGPPGVIAKGRWGDQSLRLEVILDRPADSWKGQTLPVHLTLDAPGMLQDQLSGAAVIKLAGSTLTLNGLSGSIGPSTFNGRVFADFAGKPVVKADLDIQHLPLWFAGDKAAGSGGPGPGSAGPSSDWNQPWSDREVNIEALNYFDADVRFRAAELSAGKFRFAPLPVQATVAGGVLKAAFQDVGLYGGRVDGTLLTDASGAPLNHALQLSLSGLRVLPLLNDAAGFDALDGQLRASIDVRATGASLRTIMPALSGSADISVKNGKIRHISVAKMIRALAASPLTGWQVSEADKTDLSQLSALFRISGGQGSTDNFQLTGPLVRVTGRGTANIAAKTLSFKLDPELIVSHEAQGGSPDAIGLGVPVIVRGTWAEPRIYPEIAGILDDPAAAYAKLRALGKGLLG
ncbi:MAG: AsmA family protein, partial [Beijerinckiaceae bacterium]|nr:AsmA family protein [Beijerinckiaceae bacterium]